MLNRNTKRKGALWSAAFTPLDRTLLNTDGVKSVSQFGSTLEAVR
jgi:hypothetical protein